MRYDCNVVVWSALCMSHVHKHVVLVLQIVQKAADLQDAISEGATSFLVTEYKYMGVFMVCAIYADG